MACAGRIIAVLAASSVTNFISAIAVSTICARRCAPSGLWLGASRDGERTRPASMAASATFSFCAGLLK